MAVTAPAPPLSELYLFEQQLETEHHVLRCLGSVVDLKTLLCSSFSDGKVSAKSPSLTLTSPILASQIYETQLNELSSQTQTLTTDVGAKDALLQEARDTINTKVRTSAYLCEVIIVKFCEVGGTLSERERRELSWTRQNSVIGHVRRIWSESSKRSQDG